MYEYTQKFVNFYNFLFIKTFKIFLGKSNFIIF